MKPTYPIIFSTALAAVFSTALYADFDSLRADFENPPQDAKVETWWHFTTNAITKEGITADLEAMKEIGYGGAHVFSLVNQTAKGMPEIHILDDKWRRAYAPCRRGGKTSRLASRRAQLPGVVEFGWALDKGGGFDEISRIYGNAGRRRKKTIFKTSAAESHRGILSDVAVLAVKGGKKMPAPKISADFENPQNAVGENEKTSRLPLSKKGVKKTLVFEFDRPFDAKFAELVFDNSGLYVNVGVYSSDDGKNYSKVGEFNASVYNDKRTPKYVELSPNGAKAKFFKFEFATAKNFHEWERPKDVDLKNVRLLSERMVSDLDFKNSTSQRIGYIAPKKENSAARERRNLPSWT